MIWRLFVAAVNAFGWLAGRMFGGYLIDARRWRMAAAQSFVILCSSVCTIAFPQAVSPQEFERLKSTVEFQDKRLDNVDVRLGGMQTDIVAIRMALQKVDTMDWLLKVIAGCMFPLAGAGIAFAYKAGRWVAKADGHISGEIAPIKQGP